MNTKQNVQDNSKPGLPELPLFRLSAEQRTEVSDLLAEMTPGISVETAINLFEEIAQKFEKRLLRLGRLPAVDRQFRRAGHLTENCLATFSQGCLSNSRPRGC